MLNKPGKSFVQPMKICLPWLNSYRCHTQLYGRLWKYLSSYSNLVGLCVDFVFVWFLRVKELLNLPQMCWVGRVGPIPWSCRSCEFTLLDIFWSNITEHIYIRPYGILLTEEHTEIEHVLWSAVFWFCTQHIMVIPFWCFGITDRSHFQGSRCPRRTCLDSRKPAHTWCLLE
jgi:hypothetical protein